MTDPKILQHLDRLAAERAALLAVGVTEKEMEVEP